MLPETFPAARPTVVYEPESRREMLWAMPDTAGVFRLVSSSALYGNSWERPVPVGNSLGEGGDANYPFLMPDGITLYFANDGENSLGGMLKRAVACGLPERYTPETAAYVFGLPLAAVREAAEKTDCSSFSEETLPVLFSEIMLCEIPDLP